MMSWSENDKSARLVAATPPASTVTRRTNSASRAVTRMRTACLGQSAPTMCRMTMSLISVISHCIVFSADEYMHGWVALPSWSRLKTARAQSWLWWSAERTINVTAKQHHSLFSLQMQGPRCEWYCDHHCQDGDLLRLLRGTGWGRSGSVSWGEASKSASSRD